MLQTTDYKILWVDQQLSEFESARRALPWPVVSASNAAEALRQLNRGDIAVVVVSPSIKGTHKGEDAIDLLSQIKVQDPAVTRVLITPEKDLETIEKAVNQASVFRFISSPWQAQDLIMDMEKAVDHHVLLADQKRLLKEISRQNRQLEDLKSGLESVVRDRTKSIRASKAEAERKEKRIRSTIKFVKELSHATTLDDLFILIRKELRPQHRVGDPIMGYLSVDKKPRLLFSRSTQVLEKRPLSPWPSVDRILTNSAEVRQFLANEFGRPFGRVLSIPIRQKYGEEQQPVIFLEHGFSDEEIHDFLEFVMERLQPFSISLDRVLFQEQLEQVSLQWEKTFDAIQDPVAIVNLDYQVLRSNRYFSDKMALGSCYKVFTSKDQVCPGCPVATALETNKPATGEIKVGSKTLKVHSYPIRLAGEKHATTVVNHYLDITESRTLYSRVIQNEKMAALGVMAGHIAHELNNPLTGMRSLAQLLRMQIDPSNRLQKDLEEVEKATERCHRIIRNLLEFSIGGQSDVTEVVPLNEIVNKTLPMLKTAMRFHQNDVTLTEEKNLIRVNPYMMQQVIFNLVNNACQAMENPGVIQIETSVARNRVKLFVRDTGPGIPEEYMERVFEPFFTTKPEGTGTGLGLSMSRSIIEKFGGQIEVTKTGPDGTEFVVSFPLVKS